MLRACQLCRLGFTPAQKTQAFCSVQCRLAASGKRRCKRASMLTAAVLARCPTRKCAQCNREFPRRTTHPSARYCGTKCQRDAFNVRRVTRRALVAGGLPCRWCGHVVKAMDGFCKYTCRNAFEEWRLGYINRFGWGPDW